MTTTGVFVPSRESRMNRWRLSVSKETHRIFMSMGVSPYKLVPYFSTSTRNLRGGWPEPASRITSILCSTVPPESVLILREDFIQFNMPVHNNRGHVFLHYFAKNAEERDRTIVFQIFCTPILMNQYCGCLFKTFRECSMSTEITKWVKIGEKNSMLNFKLCEMKPSQPGAFPFFNVSMISRIWSSDGSGNSVIGLAMSYRGSSSVLSM